MKAIKALKTTGVVLGLIVMTYLVIALCVGITLEIRSRYIEDDFIKADYERLVRENILLKEQVKETYQWHYLLENGTKAEIDSTIRAAKMERLGR